MSDWKLTNLWNVAARIGADEFVVRRTMEQLDAHEISLRDAIDVLQSHLAGQISDTGSRLEEK
jgi:hypothetical protein